MIVTLEEAREILGKDADGISDEELTYVISTLDLLAKDALQHTRERIRMKKDAKGLAEIVYDEFGKVRTNDTQK